MLWPHIDIGPAWFEERLLTLSGDGNLGAGKLTIPLTRLAVGNMSAAAKAARFWSSTPWCATYADM
jgi:hypothetical protein